MVVGWLGLVGQGSDVWREYLDRVSGPFMNMDLPATWVVKENCWISKAQRAHLCWLSFLVKSGIKAA